MMEMEKCPSFLTCSCNVCPLDPDLEKRTWFVSEDVCRQKQLRKHPIVLAMKKIKKAKEKGKKQVFGRPLTDETVWYGRELLELGEKELEKRRQASERMKERLAKGEWHLPFLSTGSKVP